MIEFEKHIEILLLSNDCVVVPGLGGFVAHHVSAHYDDRDNMFLPPSRTLGFNPQLTINDSLLAQSYVEAYDMSYPQAMQTIEQQVSQLKKQLANDGIYELHGIGQLSVNKEGKIGFSPLEAGILTPTLYGLGGFEVSSLEHTSHITLDAHPTTLDAHATTKRARLVAITTDEDSGQKMVSVSVKALRNAAVAALFILAIFFVASPLSHNPQLLSTNKMESGIFADIFRNHTTKQTAQQAADNDATTAATENTTKKAKVAEAPKEQWVIVLCSHVSKKNANRFKDELKKENIKATVINEETGNAKVVYGKYPSKEKAQEALTAMRSNKHFTEAWLLQTK